MVAVACALAAGLVVAAQTRALEHARRDLGASVPVVVARRPLARGTAIAPGDVVVEPRPVAFVPAGALAAVPDGAVLLVDVPPGEPLLERRMAPAGLGAVAARTPPGRVAVALPARSAPLPAAEPGDAVDLLAVVDDTGAGIRVATGAVVITKTDDDLTVAVRDAEAPLVATALVAGPVVVAVRPVP